MNFTEDLKIFRDFLYFFVRNFIQIFTILFVHFDEYKITSFYHLQFIHYSFIIYS